MNKYESKYQNTARVMNEALFELIDQKDFKYITVKELCKKAGVNRSTFYLHYETMNDLLSESVEYMYKDFNERMLQPRGNISSKIETCPLEDLYLVTPDYLTPYLTYIKNHRKIFKASMMQTDIMRSKQVYNTWFNEIFLPILKRFGVDEKTSKYAMLFYISGINAVVAKWVKEDCKDPIEEVVNIIVWCVKSTYKNSKN